MLLSWTMLVFIPRTSWMNSASKITLFLTPTALFTRFESYWASLGYLEKESDGFIKGSPKYFWMFGALF